MAGADDARRRPRASAGRGGRQGLAAVRTGDVDARRPHASRSASSSRTTRTPASNLRPAAKLVVGPALGIGGSFSDDLELISSETDGATVHLDLKPREKTGFVLSALNHGPVLFATC